MQKILKFRLLIIILSIILTGAIIPQFKNIKKDVGVSSLLEKNNEDFIYWETSQDLFGASDQVVVGVTVKEGDIYTLENIKIIEEISSFFEQMEEVDEDDVISISTIRDIKGEETALIVEELYDRENIDKLTNEDIENIKMSVRNNPMLKDRIVSSDEKTAAIAAGVHNDLSLNEKKGTVFKEKVVKKVDEWKEQYPHLDIRLSGLPIMNAYMSEYMQQDLKKLFPIAILTVMIIIFFLVRRVSGMIAPILVTLFSIVWAFGAKGLLNSNYTIAEITIPIMLIAIGCADGIHIVSEFFHFQKKGYDSKSAITKTMKLLALPVVLTSVTTALGFASLTTAPGVSIKNVGIFLTIGVLVAMIFSLTFVPAFLSYRKNKYVDNENKVIHKEKTTHKSHMWKIGEYLSIRVIKYKFLMLITALVILLISIFGIFNVKIEMNAIENFKKTDQLRIDTEVLEQNIGGVFVLDIILEGNDIDKIKEPEVLKYMWNMQKYLEKHELVSYTYSLSDNIRHINYVLNENNENYRKIPNKTEVIEYESYEEINGEEEIIMKKEKVAGKDQIAQFLLLFESGGGENLDKMVDTEYQTSKTVVRLKNGSTYKLKELMNYIETYIDQNPLPEGINIKYTNHYVRQVMTNLIVESQIKSIASLLIITLVLLTIIFKSPIAGFVTAVPVFIAILFNFAVMWLFNIPLDSGTSIIASVGMGVGIDYAIHFFSRFKVTFEEEREYISAVQRTIQEVFTPIFSNAFAVGIGFTVLMLSKYETISRIGWITALSMLTTAAASIMILPALILIFKPKINSAKKKKASFGKI